MRGMRYIASISHIHASAAKCSSLRAKTSWLSLGEGECYHGKALWCYIKFWYRLEINWNSNFSVTVNRSFPFDWNVHLHVRCDSCWISAIVQYFPFKRENIQWRCVFMQLLWTAWPTLRKPLTSNRKNRIFDVLLGIFDVLPPNDGVSDRVSSEMFLKSR